MGLSWQYIDRSEDREIVWPEDVLLEIRGTLMTFKGKCERDCQERPWEICIKRVVFIFPDSNWPFKNQLIKYTFTWAGYKYRSPQVKGLFLLIYQSPFIVPVNKSQNNFILKLMILDTYLQWAPFGIVIFQSLWKVLTGRCRIEFWIFSSSVTYAFYLLHLKVMQCHTIGPKFILTSDLLS